MLYQFVCSTIHNFFIIYVFAACGSFFANHTIMTSWGGGYINIENIPHPLSVEKINVECTIAFFFIHISQGRVSTGRKGQWTVFYYTSPQSFIITFWLHNFGDFYYPIVSTTDVIFKREHFVYYHWGCTSIYRSLFCPLRPLAGINWKFALYSTV